MPSRYKTKEEKINEFIDKAILPALQKQDLDYDKVVQAVCHELGINENNVDQVIKRFIQMGKIKEIHILTIPDEQVEGFLKEYFEEERKQKKEAEKVDKIFKEVKPTKKKKKKKKK